MLLVPLDLTIAGRLDFQFLASSASLYLRAFSSGWRLQMCIMAIQKCLEVKLQGVVLTQRVLEFGI